MTRVDFETDEAAGFRAAVREGVAQADRGELIEDEEVLRWLTTNGTLDQ